MIFIRQSAIHSNRKESKAKQLSIFEGCEVLINIAAHNCGVGAWG
jgi:hypothetical protein